ncbi:MAG: hypothetical protein VX028_03320 [Nanoarchaeota archaeon]|nr:hypothetical protein [Nanoarchaeota archaeon]
MKLAKRAQISIFIIIMIIIIVLFVFLFSFSSDSEINRINSGEGLAGAQSSNFESFREEITFCFENSVEKSLLLASARGGLIYDENARDQVYGYGAYFDDYQQGVLSPYRIYSDEVQVYTKLSSSGHISITSLDATLPSGSMIMPGYHNQFQEYILNSIFDCVDFSSYENLDLIREKKQVTTKVISKLSSSELLLEEFEGETGNELFLEIGDQVFEGTLRIDNGEYIGDFSSSSVDFSLQTNFNNYIIINKELSVYVDLDFNRESLYGTFYYPVVFDERNVAVSSLETSIEIPTRYVDLLKASRNLIMEKVQNRTLDFSNPVDISRANSGFIDDISVSKTIISNEPEYKKYLFTIEDYQTQYLGTPQQFHFLYENYAPFLEFSEASYCYRVEGTSCTILFTPGDQITLDFLDITYPFEQIDVHSLNFQEMSQITSRSEFTLQANGSLSFLGNTDGLFSYEFTLTDGESFSTYQIKFLSGSIENINNEDARSCFDIYAEGADDTTYGYYPIATDFRGVGTSQTIFDGFDTDGSRKLPYTYILTPDYKPYFPLYDGIGERPNWRIKVRESCVEDPSFYTVSWSDDIGMLSSEDQPLLQEQLLQSYATPSSSSFISQPYTVSAQIKDLSGNLVGDPLEIRIYPTQCMGPEIDSSGFSCCDTQTLFDHSTKNNINERETISLTSTFARGSSFNHNMFFGVLLNTGGTFDLDTNELVDYSEVDIWDTYGTDVTSLYQGDVYGTCKMLPRWQHNVQSITGSGSTVNLGDVIKLDFFQSPAKNIAYTSPSETAFQKPDRISFPLSLSYVAQSTSSCQFGVVSNYSFMATFENSDGDTFQLVAGWNSSGGLETIPDSAEFSNIRFLCDDEWRGYGGSINDDFRDYSSVTSWNTTTSYRSKGFCAPDTSQCILADHSINHITWENPRKPTMIQGGVCTQTRMDSDKQLYSRARIGSDLIRDIDVSCVDPIARTYISTETFELYGKCTDNNPDTYNYNCYEYVGSCPIGVPSYPNSYLRCS